MKMPRKPPDILDKQILFFPSPEIFELIRKEGINTEKGGKYLHWDILCHLEPPEGLTVEQWWAGVKMQRLLGYKAVPLWDKERKDFFFYNLTDPVLEQLHYIDLGAGGSIEVPEAIV